MSFTVCFHLLFDFIKILWSECGKEGNEGEKFAISQSVEFSCSVVSDSLWSCGLQHARLLCALPSPRAYLNTCPLSRWCHPTISSSVVPFSSCPQSCPASGSFLMSWLFVSGGWSIGASASASWIFSVDFERLLLRAMCYAWIVTSGGQGFNPGLEMRFDYLELFV